HERSSDWRRNVLADELDEQRTRAEAAEAELREIRVALRAVCTTAASWERSADKSRRDHGETIRRALQAAAKGGGADLWMPSD
ncbi:MAG: hypothetical protein WAT39_01425, partial [Planctomycetota bacterium]